MVEPDQQSGSLTLHVLCQYLLFHLFFVFLDVSHSIANMVEPDYQSGGLTCPLPIPSVPSGIHMTESSDQPVLMCPGSKAQYICNIGGICSCQQILTKNTWGITKTALIFFHKYYLKSLNFIDENSWPLTF